MNFHSWAVLGSLGCSEIKYPWLFFRPVFYVLWGKNNIRFLKI
jgi:hypothetical protein